MRMLRFGDIKQYKQDTWSWTEKAGSQPSSSWPKFSMNWENSKSLTSDHQNYSLDIAGEPQMSVTWLSPLLNAKAEKPSKQWMRWTWDRPSLRRFWCPSFATNKCMEGSAGLGMSHSLISTDVNKVMGFPGGMVVENPSVNAGDARDVG